MARKKRSARWLQGHRLEEILDWEQGFLSQDDSDELEMHMRVCEDCRRTLSEVENCLPETLPETRMSRLHGMDDEMDVYEMMVWRSNGRL